jgi:hypothetical protein
MEKQTNSKEVSKNIPIKVKKDSKKCKNDIFDFACVIDEHNNSRIKSKALKEINICSYQYTIISSTV